MLGKVTLNNILIKLHIEPEIEKRSKGGIIIPQGLDEESVKNLHYYKEHKIQGDVMQVGPLVGDNIKEGDRVYLSGVGPDLIENSIYYSVVREHDIIYIIKKEDWEKHLLETEEKENSLNVTT